MRPQRTQGWAALISLADALGWIGALTPLGPEDVELDAAAGRVLAAAYPAPPAPPPHAAIDGFAVRAAETEGASDYAPVPASGYTILAGSPLPTGTDAVMPPHLFDEGNVSATVAPGDGVAVWDGGGRLSGLVLRPADLAALARRSPPFVTVRPRPCVELRVAGAKFGPDLLTPMLRAAIAAEGGLIGTPDLILLAGRSGSGRDDDAIRQFDTVFAHGIRIRPGETAALGTIDGLPALLLPGDPVACLTVFALLAAPALRRLGGRPEPGPIQAALTRKIVSGLGQVDVVRVRMRDGAATPLPPSLEAADGLVLVPEGSEGYPAGAMVTVSPCV